MNIAEVRDRVTSVCSRPPFGFTVSPTPFSFDLMPTGSVDGAVRIETDLDAVLGWLNYTEEHTELLTLWVARKYHGQPETAYRQVLVDCSSLRAAVIRDGAQTSGEYVVFDDGAGMRVERNAGSEYAVGRLTLSVNFETAV